MTHEELALANFKRARFGGEQEDQHPGLDWRITMFFYAVVHAVNHTLFAPRHAPDGFDHDQRRQKIRFDPRFATITNAYRSLEELSRQARYKPQVLPMTLDEYREARDLAREVLVNLGFKL